VWKNILGTAAEAIGFATMVAPVRGFLIPVFWPGDICQGTWRGSVDAGITARARHFTPSPVAGRWPRGSEMHCWASQPWQPDCAVVSYTISMPTQAWSMAPKPDLNTHQMFQTPAKVFY
jgi:hypothetical protein